MLDSRDESLTGFVQQSLVATEGTDLSGYTVTVYDNNFVASLSFGAPSSTTGGYDVYLPDRTGPFPNLRDGFSAAVSDSEGNVIQFVTFGGGGATLTPTDGPAAGLTSTNIGSAGLGESVETTDGGASYNLQTSPSPGTIAAPPPCYAPGTLIDTPDGPRAVETLRPGDLVLTHDNGPQAIRWTRSGDHPLEEAAVDAKPVQIKSGALGRNLPAQDLIVSPQHRILVGGAEQLDGVFANEAFAPAKSLTAVPGIRHMKGKKEITWVHFACDRHEVVTANGCLSESLLLGPMVVDGLNSNERRALVDIFGPATTPDAALNGPPARECLKAGAVKRQLAKHLKEKGRLVAKEIRKWDRDLAMERYEAEQLQEAASLAQPSERALRVA